MSSREGTVYGPTGELRVGDTVPGTEISRTGGTRLVSPRPEHVSPERRLAQQSKGLGLLGSGVGGVCRWAITIAGSSAQ
jgi:hypothetical protein